MYVSMCMWERCSTDSDPQIHSLWPKENLSCRSDIYSDLSPSSVLFEGAGAGTGIVECPPKNERKNNTSFGVTSCKSAREALAGSDRPVLLLNLVGTSVTPSDEVLAC
jgi:hypothetical protein